MLFKNVKKFEWFLLAGFSGGAILVHYIPSLLQYSWASLLILSVYFIYHLFKNNPNNLILFFFISLSGFLAELVGVNTGILFGKYHYKDNLGLKIFGVPLMIGINWGILVFAGYVISLFITRNIWACFWNGIICTATDLLMEPVAPILGFWEFADFRPGFYNYLCWFLLAFFLSFLLYKYSRFKKSPSLNKSALWVYICIVIFYLFVFFLK
jgi:putative membrane protein